MTKTQTIRSPVKRTALASISANVQAKKPAKDAKRRRLPWISQLNLEKASPAPSEQSVPAIATAGREQPAHPAVQPSPRVHVSSITIPPFLFRAAGIKQSKGSGSKGSGSKDSGSRGRNDAHVIDPLSGYSATYHSHLEAIPQARQMIKNHISYLYPEPSEFSSWSVSLLYVLVHTMRKVFHRKEEDVRIYVMDTAKLPPTNRAHSATDLVRWYHLDSTPYLEDYAEGEFLVHGKLYNTSGKLWQAVKFADLLSEGLLKLMPYLEAEDLDKLFQNVRDLRAAHFAAQGMPPLPLPPKTFYQIVKISQCYSGTWAGIFALALITTRLRKFSGGCLLSIALQSELASGFLEVPLHPWFSDALKDMLGNVPEGKQFIQLLEVVRGWQKSRTLAEGTAAQPIVVE